MFENSQSPFETFPTAGAFKNKNVMYCKSCVKNKLAFPVIEITSDVHIFFGLQCTPGFKGKNSFHLQARHILLE